MKRILAAFGVTSVALLGTSVAALAVPEDPPGGGEKITICHATGSATNPYVVITIDVNGLHGHGNANHQLEEDIIPGMFNWDDEGMAIFEHNCVKPPVVNEPPEDDDDDPPPPPHDDDDDDDDDDDQPPVVVPPNNEPPIVVPPNNQPPVVVPPNNQPPAVVPAAAPPAAAPPAGAPAAGQQPAVPRTPAAGAAAQAPAAMNEGFNIQTAASAQPVDPASPWLGGLAAMAVTMAGLAAYRKARSIGAADQE